MMQESSAGTRAKNRARGFFALTFFNREVTEVKNFPELFRPLLAFFDFAVFLCVAAEIRASVSNKNLRRRGRAKSRFGKGLGAKSPPNWKFGE
ncbi:MAG: hypothetical protein ACI4QA_02625, partial [Candidatus Spyradosoma sp.]